MKKVLPREAQKDVEFVPTDGGQGIPALASSLLVERRVPVAVFMDANSLNPKVIKERQESTEELIRFAAPPLPVKVVVAVPELETYFFVVPEVIEKVLGVKVPANLIPLGKRDPNGVLDQLAAAGKRTWDTAQAIRELDARDIERIRAAPTIQELTAFLENHVAAKATT